MPRMYLASASPRRREILASLGFEFSLLAQDLDESSFDHLPPAERVVALALAKARLAAKALVSRPEAEGALVLAADTLVCDPRPASPEMEDFRDAAGCLAFGKPRDRAEARRALAFLAGRRHEVHSSLAALEIPGGREETALSTSRVSFAPLAPAEIEAYLDTGEWRDVAGAYRIQGRAAFHIGRIEGSWSGIVGLPIHELYVMLTRLGFDLGPRP